MKLHQSLRLFAISAAALVLPVGGALLAQDPPHWEYEGEAGPEHWGELAPEFVQCLDGTAQSPINITSSIDADLHDIEFHFTTTGMHIFNNGHTVQVNVDPGSTIHYNGLDYELLQFHFHHPSEHTINGEAADMEIHFVHRDPDAGTLAVVGVMLQAADADNEAYAGIFANLPPEHSEVIDVADADIDLTALLPEQRTYFTYQGSLTTPPCSEIVRWLLLDTPVTISTAEFEAYAAIFENDARPTQPQNDRDVLHDTAMAGS